MKKYHFANQNFLVYSENNQVIIESNGVVKEKLNIKGVLPDYFSYLKRLLRREIHNVIMCDDNIIIILNGKILFYKQNNFMKELKILRGKRPLRNGIVCVNNILFYGDYWINPGRVETNIYSIDLLTYKREIFFSFANIQHIHFIERDLFIDNYLIIGTGDSDEESGLYLLNLKTKKLETIFSGSQSYRVVSILQHNEYLIWGTDAPNEQNYIYRYNKKSGILDKLCTINGPAYYSTKNKQGYMYIATTIENRKKHKSIIYESKDDGLTWNKYKIFYKDFLDEVYFGYGIVEFIKGQEFYNDLFYNKIALKEDTQ